MTDNYNAGFDLDSEEVTYEIEIQNECYAEDLPEERMIAAIHFVLEREGVPDGAGVTVVVTHDEEVQRMNAYYRGIDAPTDILSFPDYVEEDEIISDNDEPPYMGDLIIGYQYTAHQAEEAGHSLDDELVLCVIHGTLHLCSYDHDTEEHQDLMWAEQAQALAAAGVNIEVPRFTFGDDA
jgi:probable rRNA maturation factor